MIIILYQKLCIPLCNFNRNYYSTSGSYDVLLRIFSKRIISFCQIRPLPPKAPQIEWFTAMIACTSICVLANCLYYRQVHGRQDLYPDQESAAVMTGRSLFYLVVAYVTGIIYFFLLLLLLLLWLLLLPVVLLSPLL